MKRSRTPTRRQFDPRWLCLLVLTAVVWRSRRQAQILQLDAAEASLTVNQVANMVAESKKAGDIEGDSSLKELVEKKKPGLIVPPHVIARHNATIAEARRSLLHGSGECAENCSPFEDIKVALPLETFIVGRGKTSMLAPDRKNCIIYGLGIDKDSAFQMTQFCPEVHAFDCAVSQTQDTFTGMHRKKNVIFHPLCVGLSDKSLVDTMKEFGHAHLDILQLAVKVKDWELLEKQLQLVSIMPPQVIFELHTTAGSTPSVVDKERQAVNKILLHLFDMGYLVMGKHILVEVKKDIAKAEFSLLLVEEPVAKKDTVLYDQAGDCPDELSIC